MSSKPIVTSRREFLKTASAAGAFLAVGFGGAGKIFALQAVNGAVVDLNGATELNTFILIGTDNRVVIFNPRPEMGQGTWQSMPALVAEELEVDLRQVEVRITNGEGKYGQGQWVGGSTAVRMSWGPMRKVGAAAREMLIKAAAKRWGVAESSCYAENGSVHHINTGSSLRYGDLVEEAAKLEVPKNPTLKAAKDFKILGKPFPRPDIPSKVNGSAVFGIDVALPGMLYASVQHCPVIHGKILSFNEDEVRQMPGVKAVFRAERALPHKNVEGVAVVASSYWAAVKARQALQIEWDNSGYDQISTKQYFEQARQKAAAMDGASYPDAVGGVKAAFQTAKKVVEAVYETPFAAHAPIEPMNATAWAKPDGQLEIWAPIQSALWVKGQITEKWGIPDEQIKVNVVFMGGSFGRKGYNDFVMEAVDIARKVNAPVKLIWTREDDMTNGPFRPGMINALKGGFDAQGKPVAWEHKVVGASIGAQTDKLDLTDKTEGGAAETIDQESSPYAIPNRRQAFIWQPTEIPVVWWRSVYSSTNAFAQECFVDEMAHAAKKDPLDFRLELLSAHPRYIAVLQMLEEKSNYRQLRKEKKAIGIAIAHSFGSTAAWAITVARKGAGVSIEKAVGVIDCGMVVNPDTVKAQMEGNAVMALSAAVKPAVTFAAGEAQETNFHQYPLPNIGEIPTIESYIVPSQENPGGAGEPGLPPFAPALFNAVFLATGKRIRTLPQGLENIVG
ncbi:MAG: molybdopterin cofactor-binding domain-containing protein [Saprospiraceae bacterium]